MYTNFQKKWIKDNCSKTSIGKLMLVFLSWSVMIILIALHVYKINNDITSKMFLNVIDYSSYFYTIFNIISCLIVIPTCLIVVFVLQKVIDDNINEQFFTYIKTYKDTSYNLKYEKIIKFTGIILSCTVAVLFILNGYIFCSLIVSTCFILFYLFLKIMLKAQDGVFTKIDEDFIEKYEEWIEENE